MKEAIKRLPFVRGSNTLLKKIKTNTISRLELPSTQTLTKRQLKELCGALEDNHSLLSIILPNKQIGDEEVEMILKMPDNSNLCYLDLSSNQISSNGIKQIFEKFANSQNLFFLNLSSNNIDCNGIKAISNLSDNKILSYLYLEDNQIGDEGIKEVANMLESNNYLAEIRLKGNKITSQGCRYLSEKLQSNKSLIHLDIANNQIDAEGAIAIGDMLKANEYLITLCLQSNQIGDRGMIAIFDGLNKNEYLSIIDLSSNQIDNQSVQDIQKLKSNKALVSVKLSDNKIGNDLSRSINQLVNENCRIRNNFLHSIKSMINGGTVSRQINQESMANRIYVLNYIVKKAGETTEKFDNYFQMIESFINDNVVINDTILQTAKQTNNDRIITLIKNQFDSQRDGKELNEGTEKCEGNSSGNPALQPEIKEVKQLKQKEEVRQAE